MLLSLFTIREAGLLTLAAGILPALFLHSLLSWSGRMAMAPATGEAQIQGDPVEGVEVGLMAPPAMARSQQHGIEKHLNPFEAAPKLELHRGAGARAKGETPMPALKGARRFVHTRLR